MTDLPVPEAILWNDWHVVAEWNSIQHTALKTHLFDRQLIVTANGDSANVTYAHAPHEPLPSLVRYDYVWACLGTPDQDALTIPEAAEPDRYVASAGSLGIAVSGLRAVENFLDLGHLPFVHRGVLGDGEHTEVAPYTVHETAGGISVTGVRTYQPQASPTATEPMVIDYSYHVLRPYTVMLKKTNPLQPSRRDVLAMMMQPTSEDTCVMHLLDIYLKEGDPEESARPFTRFIQSQDKPILQNQVPGRLPLDPRAELPVRSDAASTAYRRWLRACSIRYGAIPQPGA
jgi:phenylpropionate dioxygenase-like ring-hydroxylating dioxygenase large terminal subunit